MHKMQNLISTLEQIINISTYSSFKEEQFMKFYMRLESFMSSQEMIGIDLLRSCGTTLVKIKVNLFLKTLKVIIFFRLFQTTREISRSSL